MISNILFLVFASSIQIAVGQSDEVCEEGSAEAEIICAGDTYLPNGLGSRSPFFGDALGVSCSRFEEKIFSDEAIVLMFASPDRGLSLSAQCPDENQVIAKLQMCVKDAHVQAVTLHCHNILDPDRVVYRYNASSDKGGHARVLCGNDDNVGMNSLHSKDSGDGVITKVVLGCVQLETAAE